MLLELHNVFAKKMLSKAEYLLTNKVHKSFTVSIKFHLAFELLQTLNHQVDKWLNDDYSKNIARIIIEQLDKATV